MRRLLASVAAISAIFAATSASATQYVIDDFNTPNQQIFDGNADWVSNANPGAGVFGAASAVTAGSLATSRQLFTNVLTSSANNGTSSSLGIGAGFNTPAGALNAYNGALVNTRNEVLWQLDNAALTTALTGQGQVSLYFKVLFNNTGTPPTDSVIGFELNNVSFKTVDIPDTVPPGQTYSFDLDAAQITSLLSGGLFSMTINGVDSYDISIDEVGLVVPEPASLALVGLALVGAGVASRRRKV